MWAFLSVRLRRWLIMTIAVPVLGSAARRLGDRLERKGGPTRLSRGLHKVGNMAGRRRQRSRPDSGGRLRDDS